MDRLGGLAVDSWKIRQVPSKIFVSPFSSRLLHFHNSNLTGRFNNLTPTNREADEKRELETSYQP